MPMVYVWTVTKLKLCIPHPSASLPPSLRGIFLEIRYTVFKYLFELIIENGKIIPRVTLWWILQTKSKSGSALDEGKK